jgi:dynein heavy chain 2
MFVGIETISKEDWIVFRSKSYKFEEFLQQWQDRLKSGSETTSLTVRLLQEVEKYKVRIVHSMVIDSGK